MRGMTLALQQLRDGGRLDGTSDLVATFADRQALVRKDDFDAFERRYA